MRLRQPTDFLILEALHTYGRNVATNIAQTTGKSRKNVNNRLPVLADFGLVRKIGPAERSGLYEITDEGRAAVGLREEYDRTEDFEALIERRLENTTAQTTGVAARGEPRDDSDDVESA
ncbi:ArsR family transcriptional regulator [Salinarchaeum laminariae]|uniref:ArsR family transcriptional regulator n=1 Tax=Salinarchaeum laminariae TaxID=869888 RepID=UPI0020BDB23F|nr:ArsR family transcriptional regulator [Salinarchaeum laminariae]